jgi:hypothetical protein
VIVINCQLATPTRKLRTFIRRLPSYNTRLQ